MTDERGPIGDVRPALEQFLVVDDRDAGCAETMALLHAYVDAIVGGRNPEATRPGITAHLRACLPCRTDFEGLLAVVTATDR
jgi:hypothetical protein